MSSSSSQSPTGMPDPEASSPDSFDARSEATGGTANPSDASSTSSAENDGAEQCQNCGAQLDGPYCSECGQRASERIVPIWHMLNEFLEILFDLDLRIVRTLPKFLFQPGRLTKEYVNGRRREYVRPLRLYLFSSFLLFGVLALTSIDFGSFGPDEAQMEETRQELDALHDSVNVQTGTLETIRREMRKNGVDSTQIRETEAAIREAFASLNHVPVPEAQMASAATTTSGRDLLAQALADSLNFSLNVTEDSTTNSRIEQMLRLKVARTIQEPEQLVGTMIDIGPYLMFVMLPVFAFLLKLLYVRQGRLYAEHIIFTLHVHALTFVAFAISTLLDTTNIAQFNDLSTWVALSPFVYIVIAMWRVYGQGLSTTVFKAFLLFVTYGFILVIGLILLALAALTLM